MDQHRFYNACMTLMNLDLDELERAGIIRKGKTDNGGTSWKRFNDEPLIFLAKLDDEKRDALWLLIEDRQGVKQDHAPAAMLEAAFLEGHGMGLGDISEDGPACWKRSQTLAKFAGASLPSYQQLTDAPEPEDPTSGDEAFHTPGAYGG